MKRMIEGKTNEGTRRSFDGDVKFATAVSKYEGAFQEIKKLVNIACGMPLLAQFSLARFSGARIWSAPLISANSQ